MPFGPAKSNLLNEMLKTSASKEFAPGIPKGKRITPLPEVKKPEFWEFSAHPHDAVKAGPHVDVRLGNPSTGISHSFVIPRGGSMPKPGEAVRVIPTFDHTIPYMDFTGTLSKGYGRGIVHFGRRTQAEVYHSVTSKEPGTKIRFNLYEGTAPEEFSIRKDEKGRLYLHNKTLTRDRRPDLPDIKLTYKEQDIDKLELTEGKAVMPKLDGAHTILDLQANRSPRLFSYRVAKKSGTGLIEHTHKVPALLKIKVPSDLDGTIIRAETIGEKDGKPLPAEQTGGLLNSKVIESRKKQLSEGVQLKVYPFSVERFQGKDVSGLSFAEKQKMLEKVHKAIPALGKMPVVTSVPDQIDLVNKVRAGTHPLSSEGVVIVDSSKEPEQFTKSKVIPDFDVFVRAVKPAISGKTGEPHDRVGAVSYSWTPDGPIVGTVGGFVHSEAKDMLKTPDKYIGRVAKVHATGVFKKDDGELGALRQPRFAGWHIDKGQIER